MIIRIKKVADGPAVLACVRADGSVTRQSLHQAFPIHDLTHYAVETELGHTLGFFGLIAGGWTIGDFEVRGAAARMPAEALTVEMLVGAFWRRHLRREPEDAESLNDELTMLESGGHPLPRLTQDQVTRVRRRIGELAAEWATLAAGEVMELPWSEPRNLGGLSFPPPPTQGCSADHRPRHRPRPPR